MRSAFVDHAPRLEDVAAVGDFERLLHHLLDEQDCDAALAYLRDGLEHALDEARLESERKLVQEYELRTRHQAARYSAHLLLAAAHRLRRLLGAVLEYREELVHLFDALRDDALVGDAEGPELEVLAHAELREEPAPLGNVADAVLDYLERRLFGNIFAAERYRAGFGMH